MSDLVVAGAFCAFLLFLLIGERAKLAALAGWALVVLNLWSELPAYLLEQNFLYPILALLALLFLVLLVAALARVIPSLGTFARDLIRVYPGWIPLPAPETKDGS